MLETLHSGGKKLELLSPGVRTIPFPKSKAAPKQASKAKAAAAPVNGEEPEEPAPRRSVRTKRK